MTSLESNIQQSCVMWFRLQYPPLATLLFAIPNGGSRNYLEAKKMKKEGITAGVSDLILLHPNSQYHALCVEMKRKGTYQKPAQKSWQKEVEKKGYKYIVCRSIDEFIIEINKYLKS